ncbi:hypothetical protein BN14_01311 [Rhizoctonia solani AG-1 IB]|uniref:Uncharacterized protein n=1 Tax=Thanatephorus cucumeris (strain AG1-IB / isolate 7/3/14) TaxID=1108050 RepID=M5BM23_THACB|nr:hypothetical protein BN14_01311 [Rhizoctonia solani AG-1 IB]
MYHNQSHAQPRHASLPMFSPGSTPATAAPTPAPSFPIPTIGMPVSVRAESSGSWVGGIAPRGGIHARPPFQPWSTMPPIPQAQTPQPQLPPPPSHAPPPPPTLPRLPPPNGVPYVAALQIPSPPPVPPPPPKHAVTSPTVLTHTPWSDGLGRSGTITARRPPLPPRESSSSFSDGPPVPPKDPNTPINELPLPPKVPVLPPKDFQSVFPIGSSPSLIDQESQLREVIQRSLSEVSSTPDEERDLQAALHESLRGMSIGNGSLGAGLESPPGSGLNTGSGAWSPVLRSSSPEEVDATHAHKPPPPLPSPGTSAPNRTVWSPALPPGESASNSIVGSSTDIAVPHEEASASLGFDEPPPPTYEEVTGSASQSPAIPTESTAPSVLVEHASDNSSPAPLFGHPRSPPVQPGNNQGIGSPSMQAEVPVIEVVPPSQHNSLSRPQLHLPEARDSSEPPQGHPFLNPGHAPFPRRTQLPIYCHIMNLN